MINCGEYKGALNFTDCKQLERLYLTGSGVTSLTLPEGTVIKEMRLPDTIQTLSIKNQQFLQKDKFSIGHYEYGTDKYIFLPEGTKRNGHYENTYNNLRYVEILNTPIDSYSMAINAPNL
jgi:hypothetical protein